ncbi:Uncharacterised protein [Legionella feeleii]|uniref:Uncharacterized protein n=1 Tax=Legionella feeleii TaxID=453 RepID=A0A378IQL2_9GAMM|nr:Uncharacterised protein [Legionella feeleii]
MELEKSCPKQHPQTPRYKERFLGNPTQFITKKSIAAVELDHFRPSADWGA